jgi:hypothetical protein
MDDPALPCHALTASCQTQESGSTIPTLLSLPLDHWIRLTVYCALQGTTQADTIALGLFVSANCVRPILESSSIANFESSILIFSYSYILIFSRSPAKGSTTTTPLANRGVGDVIAGRCSSSSYRPRLSTVNGRSHRRSIVRASTISYCVVDLPYRHAWNVAPSAVWLRGTSLGLPPGTSHSALDQKIISEN